MNSRGVFLGCLTFAFLTACAHKHTAPPPKTPAVTAAPPLASKPVPTNSIVATAPLYVPDYSHSGQPLRDDVITWDSTSKSVDVAAEANFAEFNFSFTNITTGNVFVLNVHPSCGCTTAELPPTPWLIPPGGTGQFKAKVNLNTAGHFGTLFKKVTVTTDKGTRDISLRINILPPVVRKLSDAERQMGMQAAKVDRQAVFRGDCASCHAKNIGGQYGQQLYNSVCGICHDAEQRASIVPDLGKLTVPTNQEFWRTWITYGKPGSLMPAFDTSQGGPLTDMQIASLAAYLNAVHPTHATPAPQ